MGANIRIISKTKAKITRNISKTVGNTVKNPSNHKKKATEVTFFIIALAYFQGLSKATEPFSSF